MYQNEDTSDNSWLGYNHLGIEHDTMTVYGSEICLKLMK